MELSGYRFVNGTDLASNSAADKTIIDTPGEGKRIRLVAGTVVVTTAAVGGGGVVKLEDGVNGSVIWQADANSLGHYSLDFGDIGYPLSVNTLLNLTVEGAVTTQASARATLVGYV